MHHQVMSYFAPGDIYFDIGAHKGDKAIQFIDNNFEVVLVEPQPLCIEYLNQHFGDNKRVHILQRGLGDKPDVLELSINSKEPVLTTFNEEWKTGRFITSKWDQKLDVPITTLDKLIIKYGHPRYIKIDVEGYEFNVIRGLTQKTGLISFEFTSEFVKNSSKCISYLNSIGYNKFNFSQADETKFFLDKWLDSVSFEILIKDLASKYTGLWGDIYAN